MCDDDVSGMNAARGQSDDPYAGLVAATSYAAGDVLDGDTEAGEAMFAAIREELASETFDPYPFSPRTDLLDDLPLDCGPLIRSMMGDPEPGDGPHVHVHHGPETEEEMRAAPLEPSFTVERLEPARRTCRYCGREVVLGKHGWRLDVKSAAGYTCPDAPLGYHGG